MYTNLETRHLSVPSQLATIDMPTNASVYVGTMSAATAWRNDIFADVGAPTGGQPFLSHCIGVTNPEQDGIYLLSYDYTFVTPDAVDVVYPLYLDYQSVGAPATQTVISTSSTSDKLYMTPPATVNAMTNQTHVHIRGALLVDTSITSATANIDSRTFWVGCCVASTTVTGIVYGSISLLKANPPFAQPGK